MSIICGLFVVWDKVFETQFFKALRRGLPRPSVTDCRRLTPRGARAGGTLRRDFLNAGFPDR